ncbi:hypothetical protein GCM10027203_53730 [Nonomuraea fastidiosa]
MELLPFAPREEQHVGTESVLCPVCRGVLPASGKDAYTTLRGRLIVSNGYCAGGCVERRAQAAEQEAQRRARQQASPRPGAGPQRPVPGRMQEARPEPESPERAPETVRGQGPSPAAGPSPAVAGAGRVPLRAVR